MRRLWSRSNVSTRCRFQRRAPRAVRKGRAGMIEIEPPTGARLRVDGDVNEKTLRRVLQAMKGVV